MFNERLRHHSKPLVKHMNNRSNSRLVNHRPSPQRPIVNNAFLTSHENYLTLIKVITLDTTIYTEFNPTPGWLQFGTKIKVL